MGVLFLGPTDSPLVDYLRERHPVVATSDPVVVSLIDEVAPDWIVCYGYRHVLRGDVLCRVHGRAINLHISYLPWNRGADPNLWSFIEGTPKGVSIHFVDAGIDTGDLIAQRQVELHETDTLASSYHRLQAEIQALFREVWPVVYAGCAPRRKQPPGGSYHRVADKARVEHLLTAGWDTPVAALVVSRATP
jgi:methionyl-tRNA formyltransferase